MPKIKPVLFKKKVVMGVATLVLGLFAAGFAFQHDGKAANEVRLMRYLELCGRMQNGKCPATEFAQQGGKSERTVDALARKCENETGGLGRGVCTSRVHVSSGTMDKKGLVHVRRAPHSLLRRGVDDWMHPAWTRV
jgi:hypothetical protein